VETKAGRTGRLLDMHVLSNTLVVSKDLVLAQAVLEGLGISAESALKTVRASGFASLSRFAFSSLEELLDRTSSEFNRAIDPFREDIKAVIFVSQSNTTRIPNGASFIQKALGISRDALCLELIDGCNGFVKAVRTLEGLLEAGERGLILGGDFNSLMVEGSAAGTQALFGDGFALTVLEKTPGPRSTVRQSGERGGAIKFGGPDSHLVMDGFEVFAFATREIPIMLADLGGLEKLDVDLLALHQASRLIVDRIAGQLKYGNSQFPPFNSEKFGNLGPASIPGWLASTSGIPQGTRIAAIGYGSGLSWGISLLVWKAFRNEVIYV
jgi:3-oxoacyl-[acyl-carrier-protein] synthase-3